MKPSEKAKAHGLKSLDEVTKMTGVSGRTLLNWSNNKPRLFAMVLIGCSAYQRAQAWLDMEKRT